MPKGGTIYILSNKYRTVFYIGVITNLQRRMLEHKCGQGSKFASRYKLVDLLYFEDYSRPSKAIEREKQLKNWHRQWKINLIMDQNPEMLDLAADWFRKEDIRYARE